VKRNLDDGGDSQRALLRKKRHAPNHDEKSIHGGDVLRWRLLQAFDSFFSVSSMSIHERSCPAVQLRTAV
jgi:hypothetical protein